MCRFHLEISDTSLVTKICRWLHHEKLIGLKHGSGSIAQSSNGVFRFLSVHFSEESGLAGPTLHSSVCLLVVFCIVQSLQTSRINSHYFQQLRVISWCNIQESWSSYNILKTAKKHRWDHHQVINLLKFVSIVEIIMDIDTSGWVMYLFVVQVQVHLTYCIIPLWENQ